MPLKEIKCDNSDGTRNWKNRAFIAVFTHMLCGGSKRTLLAKIKGNTRFRNLVSKEWDRIKENSRRRRSQRGRVPVTEEAGG